jgi:riboflavin kinase/FMN adenylyltransferase
MRPTVAGTVRTIEVHLLDFAGDLYDQDVTVAFLDRLRPEQKFASVEELRAAIVQDVEQARQVALQIPNFVLQ